MSADATDASNTLVDAGNETDPVRVRRRRRRHQTPGERNAFRFRAALLGVVLILLLMTLLGDNWGRSVNHLLQNLRSTPISRFLQANFRWETALLAVVALGLLLLMIPGAEDKILRTLGLRKKK